MKTNIYLVRHAHSIYTPEELERPLSPAGMEDARGVAEVLLGEKITHVVSSPYRRAVQTVEGVAAALKLKIELNEGFRERRLTEGLVDDFEAAVRRAWEDLSFALPGGESGSVAQERGVGALNDIIKRHRGGNIVIGTHGNIMALIMNYFDTGYEYEFWKGLKMPDIYRLSFEEDEFLEAYGLL